MEIDVAIIKKAVYNLCKYANQNLSFQVYSDLINSYESEVNQEKKEELLSIIKNADIAQETNRPLCQDTGQVILFITLGQDIKIINGDLKDSIYEAVKTCYEKEYYRKSVVKDALLNRDNTLTNTPCVIYFDIVKGNNIKIKLILKGAGCENQSFTHMFNPTVSQDEIIDLIFERVKERGKKSCPPLYIGIGIGGTSDYSAILAKESFFEEDYDLDCKEYEDYNKIEKNKFINKLQKRFDDYEKNFVLGIKLKTSFTHIACLPVSVSINCHSLRHSSCNIIDGKNIIYDYNDFKSYKETDKDINTLSQKEIFTDNIEAIRNLKTGERVLLSGEIYTARDVAHKRLCDIIKRLMDKEKVSETEREIVEELKGKIIFYAGPCPANKEKQEVIGPIGPTTSQRMDKFAICLYDFGVVGTIGKGNRDKKVIESIKKNRAIYFTVTGGIASLLANRVKKSEIIAYKELQSEAIRKLTIEKLPLKVFYSRF